MTQRHVVRRLAPFWALLTLCGIASATDWPRFRGPNGEGIAAAAGLPATWTAKDFAWEVELPGVGHSSPVVVGHRLFVTTASEDGTSRQLVCLDTRSGATVWTQSLALKTDKLHLKNSFASGSAAATDEFVYVTFADDDRYVVAAYDLEGKPVWTRDLGPFDSPHGHGASPILYRDLVIVPNDQDGPSTLVALNGRTGATEWTSERTSGDTSYSTPILLEAKEGKSQLIASCNAMGVTSLDPETGTLLWQSGPLPQRTVGSPVNAGGVIIQTCGQGGRGTLLVGVDPLAKSDGDRITHRLTKLLPYVPTPVFYGGHLYLWNDNGVVLCVDPKTFEPIWTERVGGNFSGSPVCVNGLLYAANEEGEVVVVRAAPKFELIGRSSLGDRTHATPAVADDRMYFRTFHKLICLAAKPAA